MEAHGTDGYHIKRMLFGAHAGENVICSRNVVLRAGNLLSVIGLFRK